ncbi:NAD-dependent epimerase/dehydratase family protein [Mucilaginibacter arboris]|uniref:NAD-dependent epimerase/dehydratase family protein n=1 Tax=Mucilaginibacter arboris TaxID=2682090 RepID=A0A7K1SUL1_9SPHI|nr:NAD-dependent epimerase/dehydratase family protein [Mucilaginibacter arboris]MVN21011.1 NAD-dependent epimerase/dehydratase family protein [Mucilaginibacter arboris]
MILLTGASGFIGQHLLSALIAMYGIDNVLALTSNPISGCKYLLHNNYQFERSYFSESGYANSINIIIHAGAYTPKNASQSNDWKRCNENIYNTEKLLDTDLPNLKKVIYLSTLDVYGKADLISESSLIEPISLYGFSKLYSEKLIASWANDKNKMCQILRVGHVYGPGEEVYQKIVPVTIKKIIKNEPVQIWGSGKELRAFIYIKDIIKCILNALNLNEDIGPVNLVSSNAISIADLVNKLINISGKVINIETIATTTVGRSLIFDNSKMKQYLLLSETDFDSGLAEEWHYMNQRNGKYIL